MVQPTAYKPRGGDAAGIWVVLCILGVLLFYLTIFTVITATKGKPLAWWLIIFALAPIGAAVVTGWIVIARKRRERITRIAQDSVRLGIEMTTKVTPEQVAHFGKYLGHLLPSHGMTNKEAGLVWIAEQAGGAPWRFFLAEHEFVTGSGKFRQVHHHTMIAWPDGHVDLKGVRTLAKAPWFFMGKFGWFGGRMHRKHELKGLEFADLKPAWVCHGDTATGGSFLLPAVKHALKASPKNETWSLGANWVCCVCKGTLDAENLGRFIAHARSVLGAEERRG